MARKINLNFSEIDVGLLERKLKLALKKVNFNGPATVGYNGGTSIIVKLGLPVFYILRCQMAEFNGVLPYIIDAAVEHKTKAARFDVGVPS